MFCVLGVTFSKVVSCDVGLTIYETGGGGPLPKNGEEWHNIREGKLKVLQHYSRDFNDLIKVRFSFCLIILCERGNAGSCPL
jgi:wee1-like protein kinase